MCKSILHFEKKAFCKNKSIFQKQKQKNIAFSSISQNVIPNTTPKTTLTPKPRYLMLSLVMVDYCLILSDSSNTPFTCEMCASFCNQARPVDSMVRNGIVRLKIVNRSIDYLVKAVIVI